MSYVKTKQPFVITDFGRLYSYKTKRWINPKKRSSGYLGFVIEKKTYAAHRVVATAFVDNPDKEKFDIVNHKDENPLNNMADNLEWCDQKYNVNYGTAQKRRSESMKDTWRRKFESGVVIKRCKSKAIKKIKQNKCGKRGRPQDTRESVVNRIKCYIEKYNISVDELY